MATGEAARLVAELDSRLTPRVGPVAPAQAWAVFDGEAPPAVHGAGALPRGAAHTAFRIASCTKSFTAAAALLLEADGLLDIDEPLADALDVPLRLTGPSTPAPTVRDALAMRVGFPTDDPWGDRQESLGDEEFARMLGAGVRTMWPAGSGFEYSNLGYAIVGRILGVRAGMPYRRLVESRLLGPLGLDGTGFDEGVGGAITGFRPGPAGWEPLSFSGPGAFSPIGGLFSTVTDLARWAGILSGGIRVDDVLPASVVERLQQPHTPVRGAFDGDGPWEAYALGLSVRVDDDGRRFVGHSGGYPGFSARMEWSADTGVGAVAFENATYTKLLIPVREALDATFGARAAAAVPDEVDAVAWPETHALADAAQSALAAGRLPDAELLDACVDLDVPLPRRQARLDAMLARIGGVDAVSGLRFPSPASAAWMLDGPRGSLACRILLTPLAEPRIQKLDVDLVDSA